MFPPTLIRIIGVHLMNNFHSYLVSDSQLKHLNSCQLYLRSISTTPHNYLRMYITFILFNQISNIVVMKKLMEPNSSPCNNKRLTITKNICDKCITFMNKHLNIYRAFHKKIRLYIDFSWELMLPLFIKKFVPAQRILNS